jgi:hypothetical protein
MKWLVALVAIGAGVVLARELPSLVRYVKMEMM